MSNAILENEFIENLVAGFPRSPLQLNQLQESDSELIRLQPDVHRRLAITTDSIAEEIALGLYDDPYLAGWMIVMVNMSDLAAVGASPLGILISEIIPPEYHQNSIRLLQQGIADACAACSTFVLGGDTNAGRELLLTGCAVGTHDERPALTRIGAQEGDILYATGLLGGGNGFALSQVLKKQRQNVPSMNFQPRARLLEGRTLRGIATSCMDTSDGLLATLDQLMRLNRVGFELDLEAESMIDPCANHVAKESGIASWLLLAGQHGEFELLFTVSPAMETQLSARASHDGWKPLRLGRVTSQENVSLHLYGEAAYIDTSTIRNLAANCGNNIEQYIYELCYIDDQLKKGATYHVNN